jgi:tetratricopeptide (TPR) repeat protein
MIKNSDITNAINELNKAIKLNPKDTDILNLLGICNFLQCNFDKSLSYFSRSLAYRKSDIAIKYIDIMNSIDFDTFLERYNHAIRFIREGLYEEGTQIFKHLTEEYSQLIEPYIVLGLICMERKDEMIARDYFNKALTLDKSNEIVIKFIDKRVYKIDENIEKPAKKNPKDKKQKSSKNKKKNSLPVAVIVLLTAGIIGQSIYGYDKISNLNNQVSTLNTQVGSYKEDLIKSKEENSELKAQIGSIKPIIKKEVLIADEHALYKKALDEKERGLRKDAIKSFEYLAEYGKDKLYVSESIYILGNIYESKKDYDAALKYYNKYINRYTAKDNYYDHSLYNIAMIYKAQGDIEKCKEKLNELINQVPDSIYNNSTTKKIINS